MSRFSADFSVARPFRSSNLDRKPARFYLDSIDNDTFFAMPTPAFIHPYFGFINNNQILPTSGPVTYEPVVHSSGRISYTTSVPRYQLITCSSLAIILTIMWVICSGEGLTHLLGIGADTTAAFLAKSSSKSLLVKVVLIFFFFGCAVMRGNGHITCNALNAAVRCHTWEIIPGFLRLEFHTCTTSSEFPRSLRELIQYT